MTEQAEREPLVRETEMESKSNRDGCINRERERENGKCGEVLELRVEGKKRCSVFFSCLSSSGL